MSSASETVPTIAPGAPTRARAVVLAIVSVQVLVLLASGAVLFFVYRPSGGSIYDGLFSSGGGRSGVVGGAEVAPGTVVRWLLVHMLVVGGVLVALLATAWRRGGRRGGPIATLAGAAHAGDRR